MIKNVLIVLFVSLFVALGCPEYLADGEVSFWAKASTYHFFHANIFHLAINILSLTAITRGRKSSTLLKELLIAYIIATITYPIATRPLVGVSNILYAILGMRTPAFSHPWWKATPTRIFLIVTLCMVVFPQFAATTHIASFVCGVVVAIITRFNKQLDNDVKRVIRI